MNGPGGWRSRLSGALAAVLVAAFAARAVWELLAPLLAPAFGLLVGIGILGWLFRHR